LLFSYSLRINHPFWVCAPAFLGSTIDPESSRAPLIPPPRNGVTAFLTPARSYAIGNASNFRESAFIRNTNVAICRALRLSVAYPARLQPRGGIKRCCDKVASAGSGRPLPLLTLVLPYPAPCLDQRRLERGVGVLFSRRRCSTAYSVPVSQWRASALSAASSPASPERSRVVSLATSLGSCGPISLRTEHPTPPRPPCGLPRPPVADRGALRCRAGAVGRPSIPGCLARPLRAPSRCAAPPGACAWRGPPGRSR
jgi:hypothetical protein